jgi:hypothetical protein
VTPAPSATPTPADQRTPPGGGEEGARHDRDRDHHEGTAAVRPHQPGERELDEGADAVRARIADLRQALAELGGLHGQASFARALEHASGQSVSAFRASAGLSETAGKLTVVEQAFDFELAGIAERRRQAELWRREQAEFRADEAERRDAKAAREAPDE